MPLIVMADVLPFERVTETGAVLVPSGDPPKETLAGLAVTTPLVPRPERTTVCGLLLSESLKFRTAVRVPVAVGPKRMFAVQLVAAASDAPQVVLKTVKSPGLAPLKLMLPTLIAAAFPFVSVTVFWPLLVPTATAAHDRLEGEAALAPVDDPTPESETTCGLLVAESTKPRLAMRVPAPLGLNTMLAVQVPEMARVAPQFVLEIAKSDAFAPVTEMLLIVMDAPAAFVRVTDCDGLLAPTEVDGNVRLAGDADAVDVGTTPAPESETTCGLLVAESTKPRLAVRVPAALGLNMMLAVQVPEMARLAPQVVLEIAKSDAFAPVTAMLLMVMEAPAPFVRVTDCDGLLAPTDVDGNVRLAGDADAVDVG